MLSSYLKIAWRNMARHKVYAIINIIGLSLGISACIVIYLIAHYELSFDGFHPDKDGIYRVVAEVQVSNGEKYFLKSFPPHLPAVIGEEMLGFRKMVGLIPYDAQISIPDRNDPERKFDSKVEGGYVTTAFTESAYFDIFTYEWLIGNEQTALKKPFKVVLTESKARQYFGLLPLDKIIGKEVVYSDSLRASVSGVVKDWDENTDFPLTNFISTSTLNNFLRNGSNNNPYGSTIFIKLAPGITPAQVNSQFSEFVKRQSILLVGQGNKLLMYLQSLSDIHFTGNFNRGDGDAQHYDGDSFRKAHLPTLYGLMGGALFILIIAIVNFVNLSTAQSIRRAKEIGIRKVLGSIRTSLIMQFLIETLMQTFIAVCISVLSVAPILSAFGSFIPSGVRFDFFSPQTLFFILLVTVITSLSAGFYPAKVLSSYLPVLSLKGISGHTSNNKGYFRKGLIVFQFTISLIFIIGTLVIGNQIRFTRAELGFPSGTIVSHWGGESSKAPVLAEKLRHLAGVDRVALQGFPPIGMTRVIRSVTNKGKDENVVSVSMKLGNEEFIPLYQMKLLAGRNLMASNILKEFVINRSYTKSLGFTKPEEALGALIYFEGIPYPVVGVVEDFHEGSLHERIAPIMIAHIPQDENTIVVKLGTQGRSGNNLQISLAQVEDQWKQVYGDQPFNYRFLDDDIAWLYEKERRSATLMNAVMMITMFISCMGIFGLAMFAAELRTKEIGIRKVLGATVTNITVMLSREFVQLVLIAMLISSPIAWYCMDQWLQDFVYRINISWWVFVIAGFAALVIALITMSFQTIKAANANPVESLRTE